jgi:hypothetical protein
MLCAFRQFEVDKIRLTVEPSWQKKSISYQLFNKYILLYYRQ